MDRSVSLTLIIVSGFLLLAASVGWTTYTPLPLEVPLGEELSPEQMRGLVESALLSALRLGPLLIAALALAVAALAWSRSAPGGRAPVGARVYVTLAPLVAGSALSAGLFTPPDLLTLLVFLGAALTALVPLALATLWLVSRRG